MNILIGIAVLLLFWVILTLIFWGSAPARVISRTLDTDNIITSYERFIELDQNFDARAAQAADLRKQPVLTPEDRTDLNTITQSCREIAAAYNGDSMKYNKQLFKDHNLPATLDAARCTGE